MEISRVDHQRPCLFFVSLGSFSLLVNVFKCCNVHISKIYIIK